MLKLDISIVVDPGDKYGRICNKSINMEGIAIIMENITMDPFGITVQKN